MPKNKIIKSQFSPFDEWVYYKIYCNSRSSGSILSHLYVNIISNLIDSDQLVMFTFINYEDPFFHIRLRLKFPKNQELTTNKKLLKELTKLIRKEKIHRFSIETYQREIFRFGEHNVEKIEALFFYDSILSIEINNIMNNLNYSSKWPITLIVLDDYLNLFQLSIEEKYKKMIQLFNQWFDELNFTKTTRIDIDKKYRQHRTIIKDIFNSDNMSKIKHEINYALNYYSQPRKQIIAGLLHKNNSNSDISNIINDLIHLMINRLYPNDANKSELVIYSHLSKYYKSRLAIKKNKT